MSPPKLSIESRLQKHTKLSNGCWVFNGSLDKDGYGVFTYGRGKQVRAHRMAFEFYVGPIPNLILVCHSCDNPSCINPEHLFLGSPKDNTQDMIKKQRRPVLSGDDHPNAKLTEHQAHEIKQLRKQNVPLRSIANQYGISFQTVSSIAKGTTWKHI